MLSKSDFLGPYGKERFLAHSIKVKVFDPIVKELQIAQLITCVANQNFNLVNLTITVKDKPDLDQSKIGRAHV